MVFRTGLPLWFWFTSSVEQGAEAEAEAEEAMMEDPDAPPPLDPSGRNPRTGPGDNGCVRDDQNENERKREKKRERE